MSKTEVTETLKIIIDRRNKIAHEADMQPGILQELWPINKNMVENNINFIKKIVELIHNEIIL